MAKKQKTLQKRKNKNTKHFLKVKKVFFIVEKLTRDIGERCKLPEGIKLRKKLGYNHADIMICEETSIAEKVIINFPHKNIVLNKIFDNRKPDIWFKNHNLITEADEGNHENYDSDDQKEREDMFKKHNFKIIRCNPNDPGFDINKCLGEINSYVTKLSEKKRQMKSLIKLLKTLEK